MVYTFNPLMEATAMQILNNFSKNSPCKLERDRSQIITNMEIIIPITTEKIFSHVMFCLQKFIL